MGKSSKKDMTLPGKVKSTVKAVKAGKRAASSESEDEAPVVVFDPSQYGLKKINNGAMVIPKPTSSHPAGSFEAGEDIMDMEVSRLWERLETTVDDIATSNLQGRARHLALVDKAVRLGAKTPTNPLKNVPFRIRKGMQTKERERERKAKEQARERDAVMMRVGKQMKRRTK